MTSRMDCFRDLKPNYHYGNRLLPQQKSYEVIHAEILSKLNNEFQSTQKVWEAAGKNHNIQTILSHLKILAMEGKAVWRKVETIKEWRRA